jgi:hypothetical protein
VLNEQVVRVCLVSIFYFRFFAYKYSVAGSFDV